MTTIASVAEQQQYDDDGDDKHIDSGSKMQKQRKSAVASQQELGFEYEQESVRALEKYAGFNLQTTQRTYDRGVDMRGRWVLRAHTVSEKDASEEAVHVPVIGQCKSEKRVIGANYIRELEGTLQQYNNKGAVPGMTIGVFVSREGYSEHATKHVMQSDSPIILAVVKEGKVTHWYMNRAVAQTLAPLEVVAVRTKRNIISTTDRNDSVEEDENSNGSDCVALFQMLSNGALVPLAKSRDTNGQSAKE